MNSRNTGATRLAWVIGAVLIAVAVASWAMRPKYHTAPYHKQLDVFIPKQFGDWHQIPETVLQVDPTATANNDTTDLGRLYDEVLMRSYTNSKGQVIHLALAYGRNQRQELKIHRPELCYMARGFAIAKHTPTVFPIRDARGAFIPGARMLAVGQDRTYAVSYWIRIGDSYVLDPWTIRLNLFRRGLAREVDDGILVRVSQGVTAGSADIRESYKRQDGFLAALIAASAASSRILLIQ